MWDFDETVAREGTDCIKYDLREDVFGVKNVIPMWVADMDFRCPEFITDSLRKRLDHEIFGYSFRPDEYYQSMIDWTLKRHNWKVKKEWISFCPGIVPALNFCTLAFTSPGDSIIVQPPVYFPFFTAVENHGRKLIYNKLKETEGSWSMDFDSLADQIDGRTKMIIISNPHNPVGRVWTVSELTTLAEICLKNNILIVSDEIHCDLVLPGFKHIPMASISKAIEALTITLIAPSKTFNLAGLSTSSVIIADEKLRNEFNKFENNLHINNGNIFGTVASIAAYSQGHAWLEELIHYIGSNIDYVEDYCSKNIPEIIPVRPEATYMIWLDCRGFGMPMNDLKKFFIKNAGLGMVEGSMFGPGGDGFMRMNVGTNRKIVAQAMDQIGKAVASLRSEKKIIKNEK